jgi:hypothetical protein
MHREFVGLPAVAPELDPLLGKLTSSADMAEQAQVIEEVCTHLRRAIREQGLVDASARMEFLGAFDIMRTLEDAELARQPVRHY